MKMWMGAAAVIGVVMIQAGSVHAADLIVPIDTVIEAGVPSGEEVELETVATADLDGATCEVRAVRRGSDQIETNSGNDLVVESGQDVAILEDVERTSRAVTAGSGITLGPSVTVKLVMGEEGRFSGGIDVEFDCGLFEVTGRATTESTSTAVESSDEPAQPADTMDPVSTATLTDLPDTGAEMVAGALIGLALLSIGAALVLVARRPATQ